MPKKTYKEIIDNYNQTKEKLEKGRKHFYDLMTNGVTVINPINNEPVTFTNIVDSNKLLNEIRSNDNTYPLAEAGRNINACYHMYMFLYSKGITPDEIASVLEYPGENKELEDRIKSHRDDYFKLVTSKDTDAIAEMYANGYKTLENQNVGWLKHSNTPEKYNDKQFIMDAIGGSQSVWVQTNNLGAEMRPVDVEVVEKTTKKVSEKGINFKNITDGMQFINTVKQNIDSAFGFKAGTDSASKSLAISLNLLTSLSSDAKLSTISTDPIISMENTAINNTSFDDGYFTLQEPNEEYNKDLENMVLGDPDGVIPNILFENNPESEMTAGKLGEDNYKWGMEDSPADNSPEDWRDDMIKNYENNELMSGFSVIHTINLAKNGELDNLTNTPGDGRNMLDVMHGQYDKFDSLSTVAKAATIARFCMDNPDLFMGSVENMISSAEKKNVDLDNPIYSKALEGYKKYCLPQSAKKIDAVREHIALKNIEKNTQELSVEEKKNLAKNMFLMQLSGAHEKDVFRNPADTNMLRRLANGTIDIKLPAMNKQEMDAFKNHFPEGKNPFGGDARQENKYDNNSLKISIDGVRGVSGDIEQSEADLRRFDPEILNKTLSAFDSKLSLMNEHEIDSMITTLNQPEMNRDALCDMVKKFAEENTMGINDYEEAVELAAGQINPPMFLDQDDFMQVDAIYGYEPDGELKYPKIDQKLDFSNEQIDARLSWDTIEPEKEFFTKTKEYYQELKRQVEMYGEAAEKMNRILEDNEKLKDSSPNISAFAKLKEKDFSDKYRQSMEKFNTVAKAISFYLADKKEQDKGKPKAWLRFSIDPNFNKLIEENYNKKDELTKDSLNASLMSEFTGVEFETANEKTMEKLANHKWKFMGIKFSNSGIYDDIVESMRTLKEMRGKNAEAENVDAYKEEYKHLKDLCAEYIVTHKRNPKTQDGKDRLKMVKDVFEGMSNANENILDSAEAGKKISEVNIHKGNRVKVSYDELLKEEPARKERIKAIANKKKQMMNEKKEPDKGKGMSH